MFKRYIDSLEPSFKRLLNMKPVTVATLPANMPSAGIYLFSEGANHLYVGRTNSIRKRLQNHCRPSSSLNKATFAFRITRQLTGKTQATYSSQGSRSSLEQDSIFNALFLEQKQRIREMDVRFVSEPDSMRQALLEMYASVSLSTAHNDFDNH